MQDQGLRYCSPNSGEGLSGKEKAAETEAATAIQNSHPKDTRARALRASAFVAGAMTPAEFDAEMARRHHAAKHLTARRRLLRAWTEAPPDALPGFAAWAAAQVGGVLIGGDTIAEVAEGIAAAVPAELLPDLAAELADRAGYCIAEPEGWR